MVARGDSLRNLRRKAPTKKPAVRIAIVCEGEKTETLYFAALLAFLRPANVEIKIIDRECGSDPLSIVRFAKKLMRDDKDLDSCYCVIDRDSHANFKQAVDEAATYDAGLVARRCFVTIKSYPCFEYWLILHYDYSRAPFEKSGNKSAGDCAVKALKKMKPKYSKNSKEFMEKSIADIGTGIINAERSYAEATNEQQFNPSTEVHKLVLALDKACGGALREEQVGQRNASSTR